MDTNGTPSKVKPTEEKEGGKSPSRKSKLSSSTLRMPTGERILDYSDSSDESEGDGPNAAEKFVSAAAANSTIDAGNDNEIQNFIPNFGPPLPEEEDEDAEKTEQNADRFLSIIIIFKILINSMSLREH